MSQEDFAEMFHVSRQTISNWENSKSYPDLETIIKISDSFQISLDILLKEDLIMVIAVVFALVIGSFVIYSCVYFNTKNKLEGNFTQQLKENNFHKNRNGYYSMSDSKGITYSVPNQSMPGLLDFSLRFHISNVYCDIDLEDTIVEIVWEDNNEFTASAISKDDNKIVGSTSEFTESDFTNMKKLGNELGISEREMTRIIEKGNELYQEFYL